MAAEPACHPVYRSMNRPLTIWGADRRLFLLALLMGAATFNFFGGLLAGILMFTALYAAGLAVTIIDPQLPRILLNSAALHARYDSAKLACVRLSRDAQAMRTRT